MRREPRSCCAEPKGVAISRVSFKEGCTLGLRTGDRENYRIVPYGCNSADSLADSGWIAKRKGIGEEDSPQKRAENSEQGRASVARRKKYLTRLAATTIWIASVKTV